MVDVATQIPYKLIPFYNAIDGERPTVVFCLDGVLLKSEPSPGWSQFSLFDGDRQFYSEKHTQQLAALDAAGVQLWVVSGWGEHGVRLMKDLHEVDVNLLDMLSEQDLGGDSQFADEEFTMVTLNRMFVGTVVWVVPWVPDCLDAFDEDMTVVSVDPRVGFTNTDYVRVLNALDLDN